MKKHIVVASASVLGVITIGLSSLAMASAQATSIAQTHKGHRIRWGVRLNQAERDGTITSSQAVAFKTELKTLRSERKSAISKSSTKAERQAERNKLKSELQAWASANNFPLSKVAPRLAS